MEKILTAPEAEITNIPKEELIQVKVIGIGIGMGIEVILVKGKTTTIMDI